MQVGLGALLYVGAFAVALFVGCVSSLWWSRD